MSFNIIRKVLESVIVGGSSNSSHFFHPRLVSEVKILDVCDMCELFCLLMSQSVLRFQISFFSHLFFHLKTGAEG